MASLNWHRRANSPFPEIAWGDHFFYFAPNGQVPQREQPYATIITKNYPGDTCCDLDQPGRWRLNIHVGRGAFARGRRHRSAGRPDRRRLHRRRHRAAASGVSRTRLDLDRQPGDAHSGIGGQAARRSARRGAAAGNPPYRHHFAGDAAVTGQVTRRANPRRHRAPGRTP